MSNQTEWKGIAPDLINCMRHGDLFHLSGTCLGCIEEEMTAVEVISVEGVMTPEMREALPAEHES